MPLPIGATGVLAAGGLATGTTGATVVPLTGTGAGTGATAGTLLGSAMKAEVYGAGTTAAEVATLLMLRWGQSLVGITLLIRSRAHLAATLLATETAELYATSAEELAATTSDETTEE